MYFFQRFTSVYTMGSRNVRWGWYLRSWYMFSIFMNASRFVPRYRPMIRLLWMIDLVRNWILLQRTPKVVAFQVKQPYNYVTHHGRNYHNIYETVLWLHWNYHTWKDRLYIALGRVIHKVAYMSDRNSFACSISPFWYWVTTCRAISIIHKPNICFYLFIPQQL